MTVLETARFLLKKYTSGGDPHPTRDEHNLMIDAIENNAVMGAQGITDARPAAGKGRRFFWDETAQRAYYDDGANWKDLNPNGGGGPGSTVVPGAAAAEGVSGRAARADHTHNLPLATGAAHGAMSSTDKAKVDGATAAATPSALAVRDVSGRISVGTPVNSDHATTKAYVDGQIVATADYVDQHVGANGLTVRSWAPLALAGFDVSGRIMSEPKVNKTWVTGSITIKRPNGATPYAVSGGNVVFTSLGNLIPTELRDTDEVDQVTVSPLSGGAEWRKIQTNIQPGSGRLLVKSDDPAGLSWGPNAQVNVKFSYYIDTVVA